MVSGVSLGSALWAPILVLAVSFFGMQFNHKQLVLMNRIGGGNDHCLRRGACRHGRFQELSNTETKISRKGHKNKRFRVSGFRFNGWQTSSFQSRISSFTRLLTARYAQDTKNAKISLFYRIGTDNSIKAISPSGISENGYVRKLMF